MSKFLDTEGNEIKVGYGVFFACYSRDSSLHFGIVESISEKGFVRITGINRKTGKKSGYNASMSVESGPRRLILENRV